jgi:flagellar biosynthesis protein FlhF
MKFVAIVADSPNAALAQVHEQLGPEAVIVSVRKMQADGISWLWPGRRKIEVTACVPEKSLEIKRDVPPRTINPHAHSGRKMAVERPSTKTPDGRWRSIAWLEANGLLPSFANQLQEKVRLLYDSKPLPNMQSEWSAITDLIICHWLPAREETVGTGRPHVFIGPPGSGKTTALCKWMASELLFNKNRIKAWRLDGMSANSSEFLTLHCELAGVPVERFWTESDDSADLQFIDLPGVDLRDQDAMSSLRDQLSLLPQPHVHLVLNAAYESSILLEQFHAFESFAPEDLIFTHLDEERRRVKLWNFVLGTKCPIRFLGAGQKIPGEFRPAEPALLFPQKTTDKH